MGNSWRCDPKRVSFNYLLLGRNGDLIEKKANPQIGLSSTTKPASELEPG